MPRNMVAPYEEHSDEVRGKYIFIKYLRLEDAKSAPFSLYFPVFQTVAWGMKLIPGTSPSLRSARTRLPYRAPQGCFDTFLRTPLHYKKTGSCTLRHSSRLIIDY